jgi:hypothetical protein
MARSGDNMSEQEQEIPEKRLMTEDAMKAIEDGKGNEIVRLELLYRVEQVNNKSVMWFGFNDPEVLGAIMDALTHSPDAYTRGIGEGFWAAMKDVLDLDKEE